MATRGSQSRRLRGRPAGHKSGCVAHQLSPIDCWHGLDATLTWQGDHEDQAARLVAHYLLDCTVLMPDRFWQRCRSQRPRNPPARYRTPELCSGCPFRQHPYRMRGRTRCATLDESSTCCYEAQITTGARYHLKITPKHLIAGTFFVLAASCHEREGNAPGRTGLSVKAGPQGRPSIDLLQAAEPADLSSPREQPLSLQHEVARLPMAFPRASRLASHDRCGRNLDSPQKQSSPYIRKSATYGAVCRWLKGQHQRSRTTHHSRPPGRRHPQQGGSRGTAPRIARGVHLGRTGW